MAAFDITQQDVKNLLQYAMLLTAHKLDADETDWAADADIHMTRDKTLTFDDALNGFVKRYMMWLEFTKEKKTGRMFSHSKMSQIENERYERLIMARDDALDAFVSTLKTSASHIETDKPLIHAVK